MKQLLTVDEVAERLSMNKFTVYGLLRSGRLPGRVKVGACVRVDWEQVERWLEQQRVKVERP